jgi:hypothetical protein
LDEIDNRFSTKPGYSRDAQTAHCAPHHAAETERDTPMY